MMFLLYSDYARSTSVNQNRAVLRKRHDNSLFTSQLTKINTDKVALASST